MALPKQVEKELKEVEELEKQLATRGKGGKEEPTPTDTADADHKPEDKDAPAEGAPKPVKEPAEPKPPVDAADEETYKQRYNSLRGKFDSTVGALNDQVKALTSQVEAMKKAAEAKPAEPVKREPLVTDADRAEFGEDLIDVQRRVAKEVSLEYEGKLDQMQSVIDGLRAQLEQTGNTVGEMNFAQKLHHLVPDFQTIDNDPRWSEWLNVVDPFTRAPRRNMAQKAFNSGDADAVAHYVSLFKESLAPEQGSAPAKSQQELQKQVAPSPSNSSRSQNASRAEKPVYTEREMNAAWDKIRLLHSRGQVEEADRLEQELSAAYVEGRVRS